MSHAKASPSRLARILGCPGSYKPVAEYEAIRGSQTSTYASEGTLLHEVMEKHLNAWYNSSDEFMELLETPELEQEQRNAIEDCVDWFNNLYRSIDTAEMYAWIEERVHLRFYHDILKDTHGQADLIIYDVTNNELHVVDWKFGQGVQVDAEGNDQIMAYCAGAVALIRRKYGLTPQKIVGYIVQPRLNHYPSVVLTMLNIQDWIERRAVPRLIIANGDDAPFIPGKKQCQWCPLKLCRARMNEATAIAREVFLMEERKPNVELQEVADFLGQARKLKDIISSMEDLLVRELKVGKEVDGWKMVEGRSNRSWIDPREAEEWLCNQDIDLTEIYETKLKSAPALEKAFKAFKKDEDFQALIYKPAGKATLVNNLDSRPAINFKNVQQIFAEALVDE